MQKLKSTKFFFFEIITTTKNRLIETSKKELKPLVLGDKCNGLEYQAKWEKKFFH